MNWPTRLTVARLLLVPALALALVTDFADSPIVSSAVLAAAGLTDILDGYLARRRGEESLVGRLLDPLADKMVMIAGVTMLAVSRRLDWWLAVVLVAKEALQIGGAVGFWLARRRMLPASAMGKLASVLLYLGMFAAIWRFAAATALIATGVAVSVAAGFNYSRKAFTQGADLG